MTPQDIVQFIHARRFLLDSETAVHERIADELTAIGVAFEREVALSRSDRVDFMIGGTAVEVKLAGAKLSIFKQCERYCQHSRVKALVLVSNIAMGLPRLINGRPAYFASLGRGWM